MIGHLAEDWQFIQSTQRSVHCTQWVSYCTHRTLYIGTVLGKGPPPQIQNNNGGSFLLAAEKRDVFPLVRTHKSWFLVWICGLWGPPFTCITKLFLCTLTWDFRYKKYVFSIHDFYKILKNLNFFTIFADL